MGAGEADGGKRGWWGQARLVGAGEADGGKRGWWGQARAMGAVSRRAKSLVNNREMQRQGAGHPVKMPLHRHKCHPQAFRARLL